MGPLKDCETVLRLYRGPEPQEGFLALKAALKKLNGEGYACPFNRTLPTTLLTPPRGFFPSLRAYRGEDRKQARQKQV